MRPSGVDGGATSVTVTLKLALAVFLARSVAVHCTVVVPIGKVDPDAGAHTVGVTPSTRSTADASKVTAAPDATIVVTDRFAGTVMTGAVRSTPPGEPVSTPSAATNARLTPATLSVATLGSGEVVLPRPAVLSKVKPVTDASKPMPVTRLPLASKMFTSSPAVLRPTPEQP